ncbi:hypothetical protein ACEZCY_03520 [Streptacidiphilus sp. N1-12]|uniref:Uncharacterized protein n=2 Tax=Streptacidiphilus alkalitolerans TaxID=3342712 RepID=A0ABV6V3Q7_9ACTN
MTAATAVAVGCLAAVALGALATALLYRRRLRACRRRCERMSAEHRQLYTQTLVALDAATESLAAAEAQWRQSLERIQHSYDDNLEQLRVKQATALARLQIRLPQPRTLRLHGDEQP